MNDYEGRYLAEVSLRLQRAGFMVKPEEDGRLAVERDSQRLCRVNAKGTVFYDQDTVAESDQILQQTIDIAKMTSEYMRQMERAPEQLAEVYRSIHETLDNGYPITDARKELLEGASHQIESVVPDLEQRVSQSNQEELELAQELEGGAEYGQGQSFAGL